MRLKKFENAEPVKQQQSFKQFTRWRQERMSRLKNKDFSYKVPNVQPDLDYLHNGQSHKQPSITWVGHSTFFIQLDGLSIMTDPVWASQMAFQKRLAPPGIPIAEVPPVDIVLISHSHYDHLSIQTLRQLKGKRQLLVPAGLSSKLRMKGFANVRELHWWESVEIGGARFTFVPSQHWTRRTPWDMNSSHWGGWVIEPKKHTDAAAWQAECGEATSGNTYRPVVSPAPTLYFAGDSGYFKGFSEIGSRFDIDVALMPIGAYEPEWFMGPQHVTPEQALQAFEDTGAKWFVPMHYGAFKLADDTPREALCRLEAGRVERGIESERIVVLPHGETWKLFGRS